MVSSEMGMRKMKFIRPMKARPFEDDKHSEILKSDKSGWWLEPKYDGHRAYVSSDVVLSALGKVKKIEPLLNIVPRGTFLDVELIVEFEDRYCKSNDVSTAIAKTPELVEVRVLDLLMMKGVEVWPRMVAEERRRQAQKIVDGISHPKFKMSGLVTSNKQAVLNGWIEDGMEGGILKKAMGLYKPGSRTEMIKFKATEDADVVITSADKPVPKWRVAPGHVGRDGVLYPDGLMSDTAKRGYVCLGYGFHDEKTGELIEVGTLGFSGRPEDLRKHIGKVMKVEHYGQYETGALRHPQHIEFRDDKEPKECTFNFK